MALFLQKAFQTQASGTSSSYCCSIIFIPKKCLDLTVDQNWAMHKADKDPVLKGFFTRERGGGYIRVHCSHNRPVMCLADSCVWLIPSACLNEPCSLRVKQARKTLLSWTSRKKSRWTHMVLAGSLAEPSAFNLLWHLNNPPRATEVSQRLRTMVLMDFILLNS